MLKYTPAVFVVGNDYQIMVPVTAPSLFRVKVGDKYFYDEVNGIMRSLRNIHSVKVPRELLDAAGHYTVCERVIIDRAPYFAKSEDEVFYEFDFFPLPEKDIRIFHIADTHDRIQPAIDAAKEFGRVDMLVLNGDILECSELFENFNIAYEIAEGITHGNVPVLFSRGNHDLRGVHAELSIDYTPTDKGNTYYSVRVGNIWALILDCGEDKADDHPEYGYTVACDPMRERETEYIKEVIANADKEYNAEGVKHRFIICHDPFTHRCNEPGVRKDLYAEWARMIRENIHPELMLCGHWHRAEVFEVGCELDELGQPCRIVIGGKMTKDGGFIGCGLTVGDEEIKIEFCGK